MKAAWLVCALAVAGAGSTARTATPELVVEGDGARATTIMGTPARLRIDPAAPGIPMLNPDIAARARLKAGPFGVAYGVGPTTVDGRTAVARIDLDRGPVRRRVSWGTRPFVQGAAGAVGPAGLDHPRIRFQLRAPRPGERTVTLPIAGGGGLFGGWDFMGATIAVDGYPVRVRFDPRRPSFATAGAGVALARALGGVLDGPARLQEIAFGVERPVRLLRLHRPLSLGPLSVDRLLVRVADFGTTASIAEAGAAPADPDEVVVTAKGERDRKRDVLTLGRDQLDRCSSIVFDKPARQVRLSCI